MLRTIVEVQHESDAVSSPVTPPAKAAQRPMPSRNPSSQAGSTIELLRTARQGHGSATTTAEEPDLEMSRPTTPEAAAPEVAVDAVQSVWEPYMNRFRVLSLCLCSLGNGLNDSAAGALIPYMEKYVSPRVSRHIANRSRYYDIGYGVVSLIFVGQALGFVVAAVVLDTLRAKLGRAKLLGLAQTCMLLGYVPLVATSPFIVNVFAFFLVGFGLAINVAMSNTFVGSLQNGTFLLGLVHGTYGIGGTTGPLMATALVTVAHTLWSRYYLITLGVALASMALALWSFWAYERELSPATRESEAQPDGSLLLGMVTALRLRVVLLGAIFIFAYQGAEVSISGWVISFLINVRDGDPSSVGYVSAGFWAGITVGRFLLSGPAHKIGEKRFVYGLVGGAIAFQLLVWLVPNIVGNAVAVSFVGLLLGPVYPCSCAVFLRAMSRRDALSGMGTISACGSLGGAVAPFLTGMVAQAVGTYVLHPIVIALFIVMMICWWCIPEESKRNE